MQIPLRRVGKTSLKLPVLGLGTAPLANLWDWQKESVVKGTFQGAWDNGVKYIDTAPLYGHTLAEHRVGEFLRDQDSDEYLISTKVGRLYSRFQGRAKDFDGGHFGELWFRGRPMEDRYDYTYGGIMRSYEDSIQRLGINRIDALIIHDVDTQQQFGGEPDVVAALKDLEKSGMRALEELKSCGEVKAIGAGKNFAYMIPRFMDIVKLDFFMVANCYTLLEQSMMDELDRMQKEGVSMIIAAPYASGILATGVVKDAKFRYAPAEADKIKRCLELEALCDKHGVPLKAAALQFGMNHPVTCSVVPGSVNLQEVTQNIETLQVDIPVAFWEEMVSSGLIDSRSVIPKVSGQH
jgi:D-threo-aldose 1-dehydrogenase